MSLSAKDFQEIMDRVYKEIDSDMEAEDVHDIVETILEEYSVEELRDAVTIGIFVGDVWRPISAEEAEEAGGVSEDLEDEDDDYR